MCPTKDLLHLTFVLESLHTLTPRLPIPLQVKAVNGSSILRILKTQGLAPDIPEDLYHLIKKVCAAGVVGM